MPCEHKHPVYVRQRGRLTTSQARAIEQYGAEYLIATDEHILDLRQIFVNKTRPILEVGFGVGQALIDMAKRYPENNYLGIEVYLPGIGSLLNQCHTQNITNVRVIRGDARAILETNIGAGSLEQINIFFPDPWPKKRHFKRRLIQYGFPSLVAGKLVTGGKVYACTDWEPYAHWMLDSFAEESNLLNLSEKGTFIPRYEERPLTRFETRGLRLGHKVWDLGFQRI